MLLEWQIYTSSKIYLKFELLNTCVNFYQTYKSYNKAVRVMNSPNVESYKNRGDLFMPKTRQYPKNQSDWQLASTFFIPGCQSKSRLYPKVSTKVRERGRGEGVSISCWILFESALHLSDNSPSPFSSLSAI